jgi:murein tripeptide amidase MpaA
MTLAIDADFDGGNIAVLHVAADSADLAIRKDSNGPWSQWFSFRVRGGAGRALTLRLAAGASSYPGGWEGYRACVSEDGETWTRTATAFDGTTLTITHTPAGDETWFAYFPPYPLTRHDALLHRIAAEPGVTRRTLGASLDGRPITCLDMGTGDRALWILGRQHSGETMASWWMEGALARLTDPDDALAVHLRAAARLHIVPLVNIDGAFRGNLRANAAGTDLNRQWRAPDPARAPEVAAILAAMEQTGVDVFLDVHGDEDLPHVFIDGCDVDPESTPAQVAGVDRFRQALLKASPAFQTKMGYPPSYGGAEANGIATRAIGLRFGAVAITLEMPFKEALEAPDPVAGWSPAASSQLGRDCLDALAAALDEAA